MPQVRTLSPRPPNPLFLANMLGISYILIKHWNCAGVAQLVEQLICNQQVGGSNPSTSSIFHVASINFIFGGVPEWPKGADCKSVALLLRWSESILLHQKLTEALMRCLGQFFLSILERSAIQGVFKILCIVGLFVLWDIIGIFNSGRNSNTP